MRSSAPPAKPASSRPKVVHNARPRDASSSCRSLRTAAVVLLLAALTALYVWADGVKSRWYIFDPAAIHALAREGIDLYPNSTAGVVHHIVSTLRETHGVDHITADPFPDHPPPSAAALAGDPAAQVSPLPREWVFNNAGGAMGAMYIIHASITEYLIVFGTPLGTEGHSGRHPMDDYFHILEGEQWAVSPGSLVMERYPKGSVHHLRRGDAKQYKMHEGCWALELAQGWIPGSLPFGLADSFSSTVDVPTIYHTVRITVREMFRNLYAGKI